MFTQTSRDLPCFEGWFWATGVFNLDCEICLDVSSWYFVLVDWMLELLLRQESMDARSVVVENRDGFHVKIYPTEKKATLTFVNGGYQLDHS